MTPLRRAALAAVCACLPLSVSAGPTVDSAPRALGPSIPALAETVTAFFGPANANPMPADMNVVLRALQTVGKADGPTREQMQPVIERIQLAADEFAPAEPSEQEPAPGLASSVKLELLAGPLKAWLNEEQRIAIQYRQQEYGAKLSAQDRQKLQAKMMAWAHALGGGKLGANLAGSALPAVDAREPGPASAEKEALQETHGGMTKSAQDAEWIAAAKKAERSGEPIPARPSGPKTVDGVILDHGSLLGSGYSLKSRPDGTIIVGDRLGWTEHVRLRKSPGSTPTIVVVGSNGQRKTIVLDADKDYYLDSGLGRPADWTVSTHFFLTGGKSFTVEPGAKFSIEMLPDTRAADNVRKTVIGSAAVLAGITGIAIGLGGSLVGFLALITAIKVGVGLLIAFWGFQALRRGTSGPGQAIRELGGRVYGVFSVLVGLGFIFLSIGEALGRFH